jgi:cysteine desulfurase
MRPFLEEEFGNPSSSHRYGIRPKQAVEEARRQIAAFIGCFPDEIIFTSGGTESNNYAVKCMARSLKNKGRHIVTSAFEHPAVLEVCRYLENEGYEITKVAVDTSGIVCLKEMERCLRPDTILISLMHANNEVGTVQPVAKIAQLAGTRGIAVHTDAAQSSGKIPVDVSQLGVDLLSIAGHKIYAPKGVGALYIRQDLAPENFFHGAGQELGRRAGTENVAGIVGLGKACEIAARDLVHSMGHMQSLRDRLYEGIAVRVNDIKLNGHPARRLPNTLSLSFKGIEADRLLEEIGPEVAASAGAACHAGKTAVSHVLEAMHVPLEWARGTLRFSVGRMSTEQEIDRAISAIAEAVIRLRN